MTRFCPKWISRLHLCGLWAWWMYRHETAEERANRFAETKAEFRAIYEAQLKKCENVPDTKQMMEFREVMEELLEDGK